MFEVVLQGINLDSGLDLVTAKLKCHSLPEGVTVEEHHRLCDAVR
jgi:hypothetical protein